MKSNINEEVGFNIRRIREERDLSQEELATLAELHRAYVGQIERGEKNIGLKNLEKIAKALNVSIKVLLDISVIDK
ncbi:MAG: helix-turn-helix transcriptional regulator [Planctomycetes bacterium]|nr:helix-turn-helix transcriptional regulator [Planctomycetota bacterium]